MEYLHTHHYTPITVTQLIHARTQNELPERPIVLTFDDGFADFLTAALPILKHYGFVATLYVTSGFIDGTSEWLQDIGEGERPMLTWEEVREVSASGIECGAHTHTHPQLDMVPHSVAVDEIVRSKSLLAQHLEQEITSFAYPFGYYTAAVRQVVREAGFTSSCAVKHQVSAETSDPFSLPRLLVNSEHRGEKFASLITGHIESVVDAVNLLYLRARTPLWQLIRRGTAPVTRYLQEGKLA